MSVPGFRALTNQKRHGESRSVVGPAHFLGSGRFNSCTWQFCGVLPEVQTSHTERSTCSHSFVTSGLVCVNLYIASVELFGWTCKCQHGNGINT